MKLLNVNSSLVITTPATHERPGQPIAEPHLKGAAPRIHARSVSHDGG
jgi:hypothetical protein